MSAMWSYLAAVDSVVIMNDADFKAPNLLFAPDCRKLGGADDGTEVKFRIIATADQSGKDSPDRHLSCSSLDDFCLPPRCATTRTYPTTVLALMACTGSPGAGE